MIRALEEKLQALEGENRKLQERNVFLEIQMESSPDGILVLDENKAVRVCNRNFLKMWGIPEEAEAACSGSMIIESVLDKLKHPEEFLKRLRTHHNQTETPVREELELKDGRIIERHWCCLPHHQDSRRCRTCYFRDITHRKKMDLETETTLRKNEELYRNLFDHHPLPLFIFDPETLRILKVNAAAVKHYGYEKEEFESLSLLDIRPPEDTDAFIKSVRSMRFAVENPGFFRHRKKDGTLILMDIHTHEITYEGKTARLVLGLDVSDQIRAHRALKESEEKFRMAFMISPDSVNLNRMDDGLYLDVNEGFEKLTGYSREEVIGKTSLDLGIWVDPKDRAALLKGLRENGHVINLEALFRMKDGSVRDGLMSARVMLLDGTPYILNITRDITDMKLARARIQASLQEKEILLREIHHRVKNNLQVVSGLLNLQASFIEDPGIREKFRESENRVKALAIMHEEAYQSQDLTGIDFAAYVTKLIENIILSYRETSGNIQLDLDLEDVRLVLDTAIPCGLIITELVSNAFRHAFEKDQEGLVRVYLRSDESGTFFLDVSDSGKGFPEDLDFRKTQSLGLQFVCLLVDQLGGSIQMIREKGTTFVISFGEYQEAGTQVFGKNSPRG